MPAWYTNEKAIWLGWLAGWLAIGSAIVSVAVGFITVTRQIELPEKYVSPIQTTIFFALFILFVLGIRAFAVRNADTDLTKTVNTLLALSILEMLLILPLSFPTLVEEEFMTLLFIATIPVVCVNGIVLLRLAEGFNKHTEELGALGKRVIWWNKAAGWMLASVILILPGMLVATIGEFFLWRLLAREVKAVRKSNV